MNKKLNPDNASANSGVKSRPGRNRKAGAGQAAYAGVKVTSAPMSVAKDRAKELAPIAIPVSAVGAAAFAALLKQLKK